MNVHADLSFVAMVTNASFIVQAVMALLKGQDLDVALTFTNYR